MIGNADVCMINDWSGLPSAYGVLWHLLFRNGAVPDSLDSTQTPNLLVALQERVLVMFGGGVERTGYIPNS
jgi:hypothetical protein